VFGSICWSLLAEGPPMVTCQWDMPRLMIRDQRWVPENAGNLKVCKLTNPIPLILNTPLETMVFWCFFLGISTAFGPFGGCLTLEGITPFMGIFYGQEQPTWYVDVHSGHQTWAGKSTIDEWVSLLKSPPIRRDSLLPRFDYQRVLYVYVSIKFDICI
jgi:hypothetical protein